MERAEIIKKVKKYFDIDELVCNHILERFGEERAWDFLDTYALWVVLVVRENILQSPMYSNNHKKGVYQRGMRCKMCELVKEKNYAYLSAHLLGKGFDFTVQGMTAEEARKKIKAMSTILPCQVRIEGGVSWLHIDVMPHGNKYNKVHEFSK